jgi:hypothetical protein
MRWRLVNRDGEREQSSGTAVIAGLDPAIHPGAGMTMRLLRGVVISADEKP